MSAVRAEPPPGAVAAGCVLPVLRAAVGDPRTPPAVTTSGPGGGAEAESPLPRCPAAPIVCPAPARSPPSAGGGWRRRRGT